MSIRLSRDEAWQVLAAAHTGILTTLRGDGAPITLPVWFVALDERVYVGTPARTKKVARVRRDPRVSFLVESGARWAELVGVHLTGRARVVEEPELVARVVDALNEKYRAFRTPLTVGVVLSLALAVCADLLLVALLYVTTPWRHASRRGGT